MEAWVSKHLNVKERARERKRGRRGRRRRRRKRNEGGEEEMTTDGHQLSAVSRSGK